VRIVDIQLSMLSVPLRTPFRTALRTVTAVHDVVVRIRTDTGLAGYGSAAATPPITGETHASIIAAIREHLAPALLGQALDGPHWLASRVQNAMARNTSAKAAVDVALHDLLAQQAGVPLVTLLGGRASSLATDITISVEEVDAMVAQAVLAVGRGFRALKIKLGKDPALDVERVRAIHSAVGRDAALRLDPNQGWTAAHAVQVMRALERADVAVELLEQPVPAHDIDGLQFVSARIGVPVMADESVFDPHQALELARRRAVSILNIKLMKTGGIGNALRIADIAAEHGLRCMMGCMLESSLGVAAAAHVAAARPDVVAFIDLDGPSLATFDPVQGGTHFDGPGIMLNDTPGLGVRAIRGLEPLHAP
jgi:L-alanine-DL-glutamate epimerase-like enolase superfamily enzyme